MATHPPCTPQYPEAAAGLVRTQACMGPQHSWVSTSLSHTYFVSVKQQSHGLLGLRQDHAHFTATQPVRRLCLMPSVPHALCPGPAHACFTPAVKWTMDSHLRRGPGAWLYGSPEGARSTPWGTQEACPHQEQRKWGGPDAPMAQHSKIPQESSLAPSSDSYTLARTPNR